MIKINWKLISKRRQLYGPIFFRTYSKPILVYSTLCLILTLSCNSYYNCTVSQKGEKYDNAKHCNFDDI